LSNHFNQLDSRGIENYKNHDAYVIEYSLVQVGGCNASEFISLSQERKSERERKIKERWERWRAEERRKQYESLKKEFEQR
jgi:hypothetical protein